MIVIGSPSINELLSGTIAFEQMLIQTFVSQTSVEAFNKPILHGFTRCNVMPFNLMLLLLSQQSIGSQFRAVV